MLNFQESIRALLQSELNKNSQGLDFEVSLYNVKTNDRLENEIPIGNTYARSQKRFIPVLIEDISGDYVDLKDINAVETIINLSLLIPTDSNDFNNMAIDETFSEVGFALDELRERIKATPLALGNVVYTIGENYKLSWNTPNQVEFVEMDLKFTDKSEGRLFYAEDDNTPTANTYELYKTSTKLQIKVNDTVSHEFDYTVNTRTRIYVGIDGGVFKVWYNFFSYSSPNYTFSTNVGTFDDIQFGGVLCDIFSLSSGTFVTNNLNKNLEIFDFESFENTIGDIEQIDTTNALYPSKKGELGRIVFGFSIPNPTTNQFTFGNGLNYQQFELSLDAFITDKVFLGNEVKYYLNDIEIFPFFRDESYVSETDASQVVGEQITKFTATQTVFGREYSLYLKEEQHLLDLAKKITSETSSPNQLYQFKVTYPMFEVSYQVIITQGALGISNNAPISISFKVDLASNALT